MQLSNAPFRVLVIDDMPSIHDDFRKVLCSTSSQNATAALADLESALFNETRAPVDEQTQFEVDAALQGQAGAAMAESALRQGRPYAMAFVDMRMPPGWNGIQTIRELWKIDPNLQVAICTAYSDYTPEQISRELKLDGRMLILRKPFDTIEVRQIATALCDKWQLIRHKAELERIIHSRTEELTRLAMHDALTGLPNRVLFSEHLSRAVRNGRKTGAAAFAVLFIDVDEFKVVNDSLGHDAGDKLLVQIADRLNKSIHEFDAAPQSPATAAGDVLQPMAARLGGDEFAILLTGLTGSADAVRVAQRLIDGSTTPYDINGRSLHCTLSVGITTNTLKYDKPEEMLRDADNAMYHAKRNGRGRFVMFDQQMHDAAMLRLNFEADLRNAIDNDQILLHYQPIVEIATGRITGFEALARWRHPTRGVLLPADFLALAEETGLIIPLGAIVLDHACRQLADWQEHHPALADLTMSINISRRQLNSADLLEQIDRALADTGINPHNVKFEVAENCLIADPQQALDALRKIRQRNVQVHIDDFGTGYSTLSSLANLPLNGIKIDRGFIDGDTASTNQESVLRAIVKLAHSMNIPLVSEGVETTEQAAKLQAMGCDYVQGFLFAMPMDAGTASAFINRHLQHSGELAA